LGFPQHNHQGVPKNGIPPVMGAQTPRIMGVKEYPHPEKKSCDPDQDGGLSVIKFVFVFFVYIVWVRRRSKKPKKRKPTKTGTPNPRLWGKKKLRKEPTRVNQGKKGWGGGGDPLKHTPKGFWLNQAAKTQNKKIGVFSKKNWFFTPHLVTGPPQKKMQNGGLGCLMFDIFLLRFGAPNPRGKKPSAQKGIGAGGFFLFLSPPTPPVRCPKGKKG